MDKQKKTMGRPPPTWLKDLPSGNYTAVELIEISGRTHKTVLRVIGKYCQKFTFVDVEGLNTGARKKIFHWEGFKEE